MTRKKFTLPPRCPYCAHKLRADGTCQNPECVIGYVPDKTKDTDKKTKETPKTSNTESK
jgi:hypothetical protein